MKKAIAILLVICCLAAILAGCSKSNPLDEIIANEAAEKPETDAAPETETAPEAEPEKEEAPEEEPVQKAKPFENGSVTGDTYRSDYFGIGFKGEGWIFETDEEIAEENGITDDMTDEEIQEVFKNSLIIDDMGAESEDSRSNVYLSVENLKLSQSTEYDENGQADLYEEELRKTVADLNGENLVLTRDVGNIGEDTHPVINLEYDYQGLHIYQKAVFIKEDNYLGCISITSIDEGGTDQVLDMFYKL